MAFDVATKRICAFFARHFIFLHLQCCLNYPLLQALISHSHSHLPSLMHLTYSLSDRKSLTIGLIYHFLRFGNIENGQKLEEKC